MKTHLVYFQCYLVCSLRKIKIEYYNIAKKYAYQIREDIYTSICRVKDTPPLAQELQNEF